MRLKMNKNIEFSKNQNPLTLDNEDFAKFIENKYDTTDIEIISSHLGNTQEYVEFLAENRKAKEIEKYTERAFEILSKCDSKFWLSPCEECFEYIVEMLKNEDISYEDIEYIISSKKFYKGFRLFLISAFSTRKKSNRKTPIRNWDELDPIIAQLIEKHFDAQMTKDNN